MAAHKIDNRELDSLARKIVELDETKFDKAKDILTRNDDLIISSHNELSEAGGSTYGIRAVVSRIGLPSRFRMGDNKIERF